MFIADPSRLNRMSTVVTRQWSIFRHTSTRATPPTVETIGQDFAAGSVKGLAPEGLAGWVVAHGCLGPR